MVEAACESCYLGAETSYSLELSETACIRSHADAVDIAINAAQRILAQMLLDTHPVGVLIQPGNQLAEDVFVPNNVCPPGKCYG